MPNQTSMPFSIVIDVPEEARGGLGRERLTVNSPLAAVRAMV